MEDVKECKSLAVEAGYGEKTYVQYLLLPVIIIHVLYIWKFLVHQISALYAKVTESQIINSWKFLFTVYFL